MKKSEKLDFDCFPCLADDFISLGFGHVFGMGETRKSMCFYSALGGGWGWGLQGPQEKIGHNFPPSIRVEKMGLGCPRATGKKAGFGVTCG